MDEARIQRMINSAVRQGKEEILDALEEQLIKEADSAGGDVREAIDAVQNAVFNVRILSLQDGR